MKQDLKIEKTKNNEKIYDKLLRQVDIIKYLSRIDDFYGSSADTVKFIDRIHENWENEREEEKDRNKEKENENKNNNENKNENGTENDVVNGKSNEQAIANSESQSRKPKSRFRKRGRKKKKSDKMVECFGCLSNIEATPRYKQCKCGTAYCSKCWDKVFFNDNGIACYDCQDVLNCDMKVIVNSKTSYEKLLDEMN